MEVKYLKTKRVSFDIDADVLEVIKEKAKSDHRTLASYLRCIMYDIANNSESHILKQEDILDIDQNKPMYGFEERDEAKLSFSHNKPKVKGGF